MLESFRRRLSRQLPIFLLLAALTAWVAHARGVVGETPDLGNPGSGVLGSAARIEVVFVLDTTGSMFGLIEGAKQKIWSIANQLASGQPRPEIRVGLVAYRDRGDAFVTRRVDLTGDIDAIYAELFGFRAEGGGDTPESVNQALHEAVTRFGWSQGDDVYRVVFLVGDAPPHTDYQDDVAYPETLRLARDRGIVVNTIQCGALASTRGVWQEIARVGSGQFVSIAQDGAMVALHSPMDEKLATLNRALADTVVAWGDEEEKEELRRKLESTLAAPAPVAASRLGYLEKSGGRVNSGRHDLLDALDEGLVALGSVAAEMLPREMQAMDAPEREAWVEEQQTRRKQLKAEISTLSRERDDWLRVETERLASEGKADGFDQEVLRTVRSQAAEKGIVYE